MDANISVTSLRDVNDNPYLLIINYILCVEKPYLACCSTEGKIPID